MYYRSIQDGGVTVAWGVTSADSNAEVSISYLLWRLDRFLTQILGNYWQRPSFPYTALDSWKAVIVLSVDNINLVKKKW